MANLVADLRKCGEHISAQVMRDLRAAKTMIEIFRADTSHSENRLRIEEYLSNIELCLVPLAEKRLGKSYVDEWLQKIADAQKRLQDWKTKEARRFPVGVPRDKTWVRIKPSNETPIEKIKHVSEQFGLKLQTQEDGYVLVIGEEHKVKEFVKKIAELLRGSHK